MTQERQNFLDGLVTHRQGTRVMVVTEDDDASHMCVLSESLGLPYTFDFEYLMQQYFVHVSWRDAALKELDDFRHQAGLQILEMVKS